MLRQSQSYDEDEIIDIWLHASLQSHDFVDAAHWWQAQEHFRTHYLEKAQIMVFEQQQQLLGFIALVDDYLAALYVRPDSQGRGVGHSLLQAAKRQGMSLHTKVFIENEHAVRFYQNHDFIIETEHTDPLTGHPQYQMRYQPQSITR